MGPPRYAALEKPRQPKALPPKVEEPEIDESLFRDPLEEEFEALERELKAKG